MSTSRAAKAAELRQRIAGNLSDAASGTGPEPPATVVAGVGALPMPRPGTPESGVVTVEATLPPPSPPVESVAPPAPPPRAEEAPRPDPIPAAPAPPLPAPVTPIVLAAPPAPTVEKGWDKLSITLGRSDFHVLDEQTNFARASGVKMRRGGNPSVFVRAALRNFEALRHTNPRAWLELVQSVASEAGSSRS